MSKKKTSLEQLILTKKFQGSYDIVGYDAAEVDLFLDEVNKQVQTLMEEITSKQSYIDEIEAQLQRQQTEVAHLNKTIDQLRGELNVLEESGYNILSKKTHQ